MTIKRHFTLIPLSDLYQDDTVETFQYSFLSTQEAFEVINRLQLKAEILASRISLSIGFLALDDLSLPTLIAPLPTSMQSQYEDKYMNISESGGFYTQITCIHISNESGIVYDCDSGNFTSLKFDECNVDVEYTYFFLNKNDKPIRIMHVIDESFRSIIDQSQLIGPETEVSLKIEDEINICDNADALKGVVAIGELSNENSNETESLPLVYDWLYFKYP